MTDRDLKALDAALDFSKQQTAFAGILFSVTLAFFPQYATKAQVSIPVTTFFSWLSLVVSILFGLFGVLGGSASRLTAEEPQDILKNKWIRMCAGLQTVLLIVGISLMGLSVSSLLWESQMLPTSSAVPMAAMRSTSAIH